MNFYKPVSRRDSLQHYLKDRPWCCFKHIDGKTYMRSNQYTEFVQVYVKEWYQTSKRHVRGTKKYVKDYHKCLRVVPLKDIKVNTLTLF